MSEHFIKNIEIKNFKCFEDFKAEGFGRVNLIGGKNNVGKTAFMEACLLTTASSVGSLYSKLLEIKTHRDIVNNLITKTDRVEDIKKIITKNQNIDIYIRDFKMLNDDREFMGGKVFLKKDNELEDYIVITAFDEYKEGDENQLYHAYEFKRVMNILEEKLDSTKVAFSLNFISQYSHTNNILNWIISEAKLRNQYENLNRYLSNTFDVSNIDTIRNIPLIKVQNRYIGLSEFGQGIKTFVNIISSILLLKNDVIFIDEIENGIHYDNLDKFWEIVLTISKKQNVQVFATTHSKECIESYARVAKRLEDKEIKYIKMTRLKDGKIMAGVRDYDMLQYTMRDGHEVRGV